MSYCIIRLLQFFKQKNLVRNILHLGLLQLLLLLVHQVSDDETLMTLLQSSFCTISPIFVRSVPLSCRSSLMLSIHVFRCFPLLLPPSTCPCSAAFGNLPPSIR